MSSETYAVRVAAKTDEATDICSFELISADGRTLPPFAAGSHVDVHVTEGITRQYSLCNDPGESHRYLIGVLKDPNTRGGSKWMHERLNQGDEIVISAPKNHFQLVHDAKRSILLAGGIGVTPILCMAERLFSAGADFSMHYCCRSEDRAAFKGRIRSSAFASNVAFHFDAGADVQKFDAKAVLASPQPGTYLYVCGPKGFMDHVLATARAQGWPEDQLHYEFFSADVAVRETDESFQVKIASSGKLLSVPKDKTVIEVLSAAGIEVSTSCEQGVCGTCLTRVLQGEPDHRDSYLTTAEQAANDQFLPCCSRSKSSTLILDL